MLRPLLFLLVMLISNEGLQAQFIYGDLLPDAPELAVRGPHAVGVETVSLMNPGQLNLLEANGDETPTYDRAMLIEVWYPAEVTPANPMIEYGEVMGISGNENRPLIPFEFKGRATRAAQPKRTDVPYPLVIVSHGYVGSRYLMTYLTENLASKGYVVVAIDHKESTFQDAGPFYSTLYNRSLDVLFVLNEMARLGKKDAKGVLAGLINAEQTAVVGYSMGGYGALNVGGAGYSPELATFFAGQTGGCTAIEKRCMGNAEYAASMDDRIKAIVAFAPWGQNFRVWNEEGLQGLKTPTFLVAGSQDDISGYENGTKAIYEGAVNADRYLLTFEGARHNIAPNPAPPEALAPGLELDEYLRYADSVWDTRRMNNINQHFVTAFLGLHLKGEETMTKYLDLPADANTNVWEGFLPRTAVGLELLHAK